MIDFEALGLEAPAPAEPEVDEPPVKPRRRAKRKRKRASKDLPRCRVEHSLPEQERVCTCCDEVMPAIREEIHERIDYKPASFEVIENVTFVCSCRKGCDEKSGSSTKPPQMVEKGLPGQGLLAHVVVSK